MCFCAQRIGKKFLFGLLIKRLVLKDAGAVSGILDHQKTLFGGAGVIVFLTHPGGDEFVLLSVDKQDRNTVVLQCVQSGILVKAVARENTGVKAVDPDDGLGGQVIVLADHMREDLAGRGEGTVRNHRRNGLLNLRQAKGHLQDRVLSLDELSGSQMTLKFQILCRNQDQLKVKRALNREVRLMLARNGFIIPFPQVTISTRKNREEDEEEEMEREKEEEMEREENKEQTE